MTASLDDLESVDHHQNIIDEITVDSMPPEDEPQPSDSAIIKVLEALTSHVEAAKRKRESGGGKPARRLTKIEYSNTVYDLTGVHADTNSLQNDGAPGAFDTQADALYITDMYFETYLVISRDTVRRFIASRDEKPGRRELKDQPAPKDSKKKKGASSFNLSGKAVPSAGHLIVSLTCWSDTPQSKKPIFTTTVTGKNREVLGTKSRPLSIESIFYERKEDSWSRPDGMGLGKIKLTQVISPQPYLFFAEYSKKFSNRNNMPATAAKSIIGKFAELMNRGRKVDPKLLEGLNKLFLQGRQQGEPFGEAIVEPMALSMCTIEAMFHFEDRDFYGENGTVSPIDQAGRLAYFLWRSAPDSELIKLAQSGKLTDPTIRNSLPTAKAW